MKSVLTINLSGRNSFFFFVTEILTHFFHISSLIDLTYQKQSSLYEIVSHFIYLNFDRNQLK